MTAALSSIPLGWLALIAGISITAGILAWRRSGPVEGPDRPTGWRADREDVDLYPWKDGER